MAKPTPIVYTTIQLVLKAVLNSKFGLTDSDGKNYDVIDADLLILELEKILNGES